MAGIFILIVLYVALLIHLKPSLKSKKSHEAELNFEIRQQSPEEEPVETSVQPTIPVETKGIVEEPKAEVQTPKEPVPPPPKEIPKKGGPPGCSYYFGYLGELPKNTPIPDECLGCLKLMECLTKRSTKSKT